MTLYKNLIRDNMLKMKNSCRGISRNIFNDFLILRTAFFKEIYKRTTNILDYQDVKTIMDRFSLMFYDCLEIILRVLRQGHCR